MYLRKLSSNDGEQMYLMLQNIGSCENSFSNPVHGMGYEKYKQWLVQQEEWSEGLNLPKGYVAQTIYWLMDDNNVPVGIGKIRHALTDNSRKNGGNVGYAISSEYRGHGYGTIILKLLVAEAKKMKLEEIMLTVDKYNNASKRVIEANGGILFNENSERWYFHIP